MSHNKSVIQVKDLSKRYRIGSKEQTHDTFVGMLSSWFKAPLRNLKKIQNLNKIDNEQESNDLIWALKDITFDVKKGEVLGVIGRNGAGKSTLLKVISRITQPSSGEVLLNGRVASLLEVGTGFHMELTGRENIFLNGSILGMNKYEIEKKFDEIVDFSGINKFVDTPVKRYSSGMIVRLGFSVAAHLEPEILLIDEVLAVGDAEFRKKCLNKMDSVSKSGRTVIFVSHNMGAIQSLCNRTICVDNGMVVFNGDTSKAIDHYYSIFSKAVKNENYLLEDRKDRKGNGRTRFVNVNARTHYEKGKNEIIQVGKPFLIVFDYQSKNNDTISEMEVGIDIKDINGYKVVSLCNRFTSEKLKNLKSNGSIICNIPKCSFYAGIYFYNITIYIDGILSDKVHNAGSFEVHDGDYYGTGHMPAPQHSSILIPHKWESAE